MGEPTSDQHRGRRAALRVLGVLLLLVGVFLLLVALVDFFGAASSDDPTASADRFWMAFVGLPLAVAGGWLLQAGFVGAASSFIAEETAPAVRRTGEAWRDEESGGRSCPRCGRPARAGARFCDGCGTGLG